MENLNGSIILQGLTVAQFCDQVTEHTFMRLKDFFKNEALERETSENELITEKEAMKITKLSRQTLKSHRDSGRLKYMRIGGAVRYSKKELLNHNVKSKFQK